MSLVFAFRHGEYAGDAPVSSAALREEADRFFWTALCVFPYRDIRRDLYALMDRLEAKLDLLEAKKTCLTKYDTIYYVRAYC